MQSPNYPTNWQLGKAAGSINEIPTGYKVRLSPPQSKQITEFFTLSKYKNKDEAFTPLKI